MRWFADKRGALILIETPLHKLVKLLGCCCSVVAMQTSNIRTPPNHPTTEPQKHRRPHSHDNLLDSELVKVPASIATETLVYRKLDILLFSQLSSGHEDMLLGLYQIKQTLAHPPGRINKPIRTSFLCNPHGSGIHWGKKGFL